MRTLDFELGEVIAEREVLFAPDVGEPHNIVVRLGRPVPDPRAPEHSWCCPYQVLGIGRDRVFAIFGMDAIAVLGAAAAVPFPVFICVMGGVSWWFARMAKGKGIIS